MRGGASYVAFGAMYPSGTKPNAVKSELDLLSRARSLGVPAVAIGCITLDRVPELISAGANAIAGGEWFVWNGTRCGAGLQCGAAVGGCSECTKLNNLECRKMSGEVVSQNEVLFERAQKQFPVV